MAFVERERMLGSFIRALNFAISSSRKWFLINRTYSINTTAGSVNQSKIQHLSSGDGCLDFLPA